MGKYLIFFALTLLTLTTVIACKKDKYIPAGNPISNPDKGDTTKHTGGGNSTPIVTTPIDTNKVLSGWWASPNRYYYFGSDNYWIYDVGQGDYHYMFGTWRKTTKDSLIIYSGSTPLYKLLINKITADTLVLGPETFVKKNLPAITSDPLDVVTIKELDFSINSILAIDKDDNIYFSSFSTYSNAIYKMSKTGNVTLVAGYADYRQSLPYDSSPVVPAIGSILSLNINNLTVDGLGNIYYNDGGVIYKVSVANNTRTTLLSQTNQISGLAADKNGNVYFSTVLPQKIRKIDTNGNISDIAGTNEQATKGDNGPAIAASFFYATRLSLDSKGNLYVIDNTTRIRKIDMSSGIISTVFGSDVAGNTGDGGLAASATITASILWVSQSGDIYISDRKIIRKINASDGKINTIAGYNYNSYSYYNYAPALVASPHATAVSMEPLSIITDSNNNVYFISFSLGGRNILPAFYKIKAK